MDTLRVFTAFSGYDSQCLALSRLGIPYDLVGWSEIDPFAIRAHNALFPQWEGRNYGDIAAIDWAGVPDFGLFTYSFPCTDISVAGKQRGLAEGSGTASSLLWECRRAIEAKRPKYLLMENVKALLSRKFRPLFGEWERTVARMGYTNFVKVLNARDYGVPQNRERVFMVSILGTSSPESGEVAVRPEGCGNNAGGGAQSCGADPSYSFPAPLPLTRRLRDVLEADVPQKYFLSAEMLDYFARVTFDTSHNHAFNPKCGEDIANAVTAAGQTRADGNYVIAALRGRDPENPSNRRAGAPTAQRLEIGGEVSNTLTSVQKDNLVLLAPTHAAHSPHTPDGSPTPANSRAQATLNLPPGSGYAIRRLTPRECFRLMGVADADIDRIQRAGISDTQQYRMAGNSIVVDVLCHIFRKLFIDKENENQQQTLF